MIAKACSHFAALIIARGQNSIRRLSRGALGEFVGLVLAITWFYRYAPRFFAAIATAAYLAFAYGYAAQHFFSLDPQWTGGIALVAALIGYSLGNAASERR